MRVAPIIHTRTFSCDFNSEFMVRPETFMDNDVKWVRKNVLMATGAIDSLNGERWMIVDNGKYRVAGVVGFLKNIAEKCNLSDEQRKDAEELFCDDKGRLVYAFIGVVIDKQNNDDYGLIGYDYLWNVYTELIKPIWKRTYQQVITKGFMQVEFCRQEEGNIAEPYKVGLQELYETNVISDYNLFSRYLCDANRADFTFCSNIQDFNLAKSCDFTVMTTNQNTITRLKRDNVIIPSFQPDISSRTETESISQYPQPKETETKKKSMLVLIVCLLIFVIIILILLLLTGNSSTAGTLALNVMHCQSQLALQEVVMSMF